MDLEKRIEIEFLVDELFEGLKLIDIFADYQYSDYDNSSFAYFGLLYYLGTYRANAFIEFAIGADTLEPEEIPDNITTYHPFEEGSYKEPNNSHILNDMFTEGSYDYLQEFLEIFQGLDHELLNDNFYEIVEVAFYRLINLQKPNYHVTLPIELNLFIESILALPKDAKVYVPYSGFGTLITSKTQQVEYTVQEEDELLREVAQLRFDMLNITGIKQLDNNPEVNWNPTKQKFDCIIVAPQFFNKKHAMWGGLEHPYRFCIEKGIDSLSDKGKMFIMVPSKFLSNVSDKKLKQKLIKNDLIETVINFPSGFLNYTSTASALLIINKDKQIKKTVNFIDASELIEPIKAENQILDYKALIELYKSESKHPEIISVTNKAIESNNYLLNIGRYLLNNIEGERLGSICDKYRGPKTLSEPKGLLVKIKDLKNNHFDALLKTDDLIEDSVPIGAVEVNTSCLLLSRVGQSLNPTIFEFSGQSIYIQDNIIALKVNEEMVNLDFLISELNSEKVFKQLTAFRLGAALSTIPNSDLMKIRIELPELKEQKIIVESAKKTYLQAKKREFELEQEIFSLKEDVADENSFLRHQIAGSLKNVRGAFSKIRQIIDKEIYKTYPEIYNLKADDRLDTTFSDYLEIIDRDLGSINKSVNNAGDAINLMDFKKETIDIVKFVSSYVEEIKSRPSNIFKISFTNDDEEWAYYKIKNILIDGDKEHLRKMLDNLIENAERHGFNNRASDLNEIGVWLQYDFEKSMVILSVDNYCHNKPKSFSKDNFIRNGSKAGENSGDGFGGWYINEIIKAHDGRLKTMEINEEKLGYTASIYLEIPIKIN